MLLPLLLSAVADQAVEESFGNLQYLLEKVTGWGVDIGGRIISAAIIFLWGAS